MAAQRSPVKKKQDTLSKGKRAKFRKKLKQPFSFVKEHGLPTTSTYGKLRFFIIVGCFFFFGPIHVASDLGYRIKYIFYQIIYQPKLNSFYRPVSTTNGFEFKVYFKVV